MKIQQECLPFRPITLKFERQLEAKAFFDLMDKLDRYYSHSSESFTPNDFTPDQRALIVQFVNSRSMGVTI
jgi:hypothetical protein